jgi:hypothetical protein
MNMFHVVGDQQTKYILALPDVKPYATDALSSIEYVMPAPNAGTFILYDRLFEELKTVLFLKVL